MVCFCFFLSLRASSPIMASKANLERTLERGRRPLALESSLASYFFFATVLLYFLGPEVFFVFSRAWSVAKMKRKKRAAEREKVSIVCQGRKPFESGNTRLHRQTSLFLLYEMPMSSTDHKNAYISFNGKSSWSRCPKLENTVLRTFSHWIKDGRLMIEVLFAMPVVNWQSFTSGAVVTGRCRASTVFIRLSALGESRRLFEAGRLLQLSAVTVLCSNKTWRYSKAEFWLFIEAVCLRKLCLHGSLFFCNKRT